MVRAPASLLELNEEMFNRKAKKPFPPREPSAGSRAMSPDVMRFLKPTTSPVAAAQTRACRAARGDIRMRNSMGGRAREPVMKRLVTTVCDIIISD